MSIRERWKPIDGYTGLYEVSDYGRIRALARSVEIRRSDGTVRVQHRRARILRPGVSGGYAHCTLRKQGRNRQFYVHRLVAIAFIGPPPFKGALVLHEDDDPSNMRPSNLRWGTHDDNMSDKVSNGGQVKGEAVNTATLTARDVQRIMALIGKQPYAIIAKAFGVSKCTISDIKNGRSWSHVTGVRYG